MNQKIITTCLSLLMAGTLSAAEVVSAPVGFLQITFPPAINTSFSVPLQKNPSAVGPVTARGTSTVTDSNASWTSGQFASASNPYFLKLVSGVSSGRYFLITANTASQITVDTRGLTLSSVVTVNDRYQIIAAPTLGRLFGTTSVPFLKNASKSGADYIQIWNGTAWISYWHNGTQWTTSGTIASQNNVILYPDESILVYRRGTTPLTFAIAGEASMIAEQTEIAGPGNTSAANRYPVDVKLKNLGLLVLPNWISAIAKADADQIQIREGSNWVSYWHTGTQWKKGGTSAVQDDATVKAGAGYIILRKSSSVGVNSYASQPKPY
jgi:uncharacterized protein (TIGR02597 family)